jgi:oligopeptide/dipeptide ABC transporter ATP-binding protein
MYLGKIVELANSKDIYANPLHPYTQMLLSAVPSMDPEKKSKPQIPKGELPNPRNPPPGCRFHPRCPLAKDICRIEEPPLVSYGGHLAACHVVAEEKAKGKEAPVVAIPTTN